ncbi:MAG: HRDC domain-containing protein, partial [Chitinophagales bacterium]
MNYDAANEMFKLAADLVNQSSRNIFLTGKAGTGKTTFLKYIRENCAKQMAIVAPTGVAAINAGGVTIHSFFQLPLSPFIPETGRFSSDDDRVINRKSLIGRLRITKEKLKLLRQLELVIIDEISMVRCDMIDAIDTVLRYTRKRPDERFGGVQMLFIGDMFQLPPVVKDPEWRILSEFYNSPYFFDSITIKEDPPACIEFNKIYRQSEERFISLLNQVRNNELDDEGMKILEERYQPSFRRNINDGYIILTTHNETARTINANELTKIDSKAYVYKADIEGEVSESAYPADEILHLKLGAQVMFIKNDSDKGKRYFNGKLGVVTRLDENKITVQCNGDADVIEVGKEKWENIRYTLNRTSRMMEEQVLGSFTQYPLRLAWAITIHKSQGLTFKKAIIDAGEAFAAGQVYVALSRCTSLQGMVLRSKIRHNSLFSDQRIVDFSRKASPSNQLGQELVVAKRDYLHKLLLSAFDFRIALNNGKDLSIYIIENQGSFNVETLSWMDELLKKINSLQQTANKFQLWLSARFLEEDRPEVRFSVQERANKAAEHFIQELTPLIEFLQKSPAITDSRTHAKEYNEDIRELFAELAAKRYLFQGFGGAFDVDTWHKRKKSFVLPSFTINAYAGASEQRKESSHPILHQQLRKLRDAICSRKDLPIYIVAGTRTLDEMTQYLPQTLPELRKISGFGDAKINQYGQQFLDIILEYCQQEGLSSLINEKSAKRERKQGNREKRSKGDTKAETFRLYKEGKGVDEIARDRNLTIQTIETHLAHYVSIG